MVDRREKRPRIRGQAIGQDHERREGRHGMTVLDGRNEGAAERPANFCLAEARRDTTAPDLLSDSHGQWRPRSGSGLFSNT